MDIDEESSQITDLNKLNKNKRRVKQKPSQNAIEKEICIKKAERGRNWYASLTTEQRKKRCDYKRVQRARQKVERLEHRTADVAAKPNEKPSKESSQKSRLDLNNERLLFMEKYRYTPEQKLKINVGKWCDIRNPLNILFQQMIDCDINLAIIPELNGTLLKNILRMFTFDYPDDSSNVKPLQNLSYEIEVCLLVDLLKKWERWTVYRNLKCIDTEQAYTDLYCYLENNLNDMQGFKDKYINEELNSYFGNSDDYVSTTCSLKELKVLFYHNPQNHKNYYLENVEDRLFNQKLPSSSLPSYMFNWPFISTQIKLPNFIMIHQIRNMNEFNLVNMTNELKIEAVSSENKKPFLEFNTVNDNDSISTTFLERFLEQLEDAINNRSEKDIPFQRKMEIKDALTEITKDISLCLNKIEKNKNYFINLNPYPYVRYFGYPDSGALKISLSDQKRISNNDVNVRLQQICHPKICFVMKEFNIVDGDNIEDIEFDESFLKKLNTCIEYKCTLCNVILGSHSPSKIIIDHIVMYHGHEPDWECVNCGRSFASNLLSRRRWWHTCSKPGKTNTKN